MPITVPELVAACKRRNASFTFTSAARGPAWVVQAAWTWNDVEVVVQRSCDDEERALWEHRVLEQCLTDRGLLAIGADLDEVC